MSWISWSKQSIGNDLTIYNRIEIADQEEELSYSYKFEFSKIFNFQIMKWFKQSLISSLQDIRSAEV